MKDFLFPEPSKREPFEGLNKGWTQRVLDHGYVKYIDSMGTDQTIIEAARMSTQRGFISWDPYQRCEKCDAVCDGREKHDELVRQTLCAPGGKGTGEHQWKKFPRGDNGLLETLWRDGHHTPFEMCELHIEVKAPIFVFREWHRHRTQSYNEMSARYVQMPNEHYLPDLSRFEPKQTGNKQESSAKHPETVTHDVEAHRFYARTEQESIYENYEGMLESGVPREVARINTPVSRYSVMRAKMDLRNALGFLKLRDHKAAQWEMQQYAKAADAIVKTLWPRTHALYEEHTKYAVTLTRAERNALVRFMESGRGVSARDVIDGINMMAVFNKLQG